MWLIKAHTSQEAPTSTSGSGSLSVMLPYSMCFLVGWTIFLVIWFMTGLPIGMEGAIHLTGM